MALRRSQVAVAVISRARRLVANTPVQHLAFTTWVYRLVFRFGFRHGDVSCAFRGLILTVPTADLTVSPGILGGYYEGLALDLYIRAAKTSTHILDIGGNIGVYAALGAQHLPPNGRVTVFEPIPENLTYLRRNLEQNRLQHKVDVWDVAVGDESGILRIHLAEGSMGTHSASARNVGRTSGALDVAVVTLDDHVRDHGPETIDILKIDVEGYDGHVLRGAESVLEQRPALFVEFAPNFLDACGFPSSDFVDLIFDRYGTVLAIDDVRGDVQTVRRADLMRRLHSTKAINLVAVDRDHHVALVEQWLPCTQT